MPDGAHRIDPELVAGRIATLLQDRRPGAVKPLLAALEKLAPEHPALVMLRVAYCCQMQDFPQALEILQRATAKAPGDAALHLRRAEILFGQGDYGGAAQDAAAAILAAPRLTRAKSVLGLALLHLGAFDSALPCLAESFAADPAQVDVALALAALAPERGIEILGAAIAATPQLRVLRNALARRHLCAGDFAQAARIASQARADGLAAGRLTDAETNCLLAFAQIELADWDAAQAAAAQALQLAPGNAWAARLQAALKGRICGALAVAPQTDADAAEHGALSGGTIFPGACSALLRESPGGPVLDLFCGTGLNAIAAGDVGAGAWTGIEPDPILAARCAARGRYARVEICRPEDFVGAAPYAVILLNEALAYRASPEPWFALLRRCLAPGGMALAAIPTGRGGLSGHALFTHEPARIAEQAARFGLAFSVRRSGILRHLEGIPLHGVIAGLRPL